MITIYGATWCPYCVKAKELCEERNIPFEYIDVDELEEPDERVNPAKPIPQIYDGDTFIGGYTELRDTL